MPRTYRNNSKSELVLIKLILISLCVKIARTCNSQVRDESVLDRELKNYVDRVLKAENVSILPGVGLEKIENITKAPESDADNCVSGRAGLTLEDYVKKRFNQYAESHVLSVDLRETSRFFSSSNSSTGKQFVRMRTTLILNDYP